jgi:hypothetical protein
VCAAASHVLPSICGAGLLPPEHRFHEAQTPQWESAGGGAGAARPGAGGGMNLVGARRGDAGFDGDAAMLPGHGGSLGGGMRGYRENGAVHSGGGGQGAARGGGAGVGEMRSGAHTDIGASSGMQLVNAGGGGAGWGGGGIGGGGQLSVGGSASEAFWSEKEKEVSTSLSMRARAAHVPMRMPQLFALSLSLSECVCVCVRAC